MGNTMTPREKLSKAYAQALKEYMRDTASARRTRTRRKNRADKLFRGATGPAMEEQMRKRTAALDEFVAEVRRRNAP